MSVSIDLLRDDFTNNVRDPAWGDSSVVGSATLSETGGQAVCTLPSSTAGSHEAAYISSAVYDITGSGAFVVIGTMVTTGVAATAYFDLRLDNSNYLRWRQVSNVITARTVVAGVDTQLFTAAWSSSTYKYLRIRESAGTVFFDSSTNGTSWTNRASVANPFAVTALFVAFGVSGGNIASPGSLKLDDFNPILPAPSSTWRETTADWSISNRLRSVTLASDGGKQGVVVTADTMDSSRTLGGTLRYFAGPLGSTSGGYLQMTEYASLVLAQASAFPIPVSGRVDLPAMVDARYMRLYHRSTDASAHTIYEFVPRRLVQADDIEAESITAINISAGAVTADKIFVLSLAAITANIGGLNIDTTGYLWQGTGTAASPTTGLKIFNSGGVGKLSTYNSGVEQVTLDTDGKLKGGAGVVVMDAGGIGIVGSTTMTDLRSYKFFKSDGTTIAGRIGAVETVAPSHNVTLNAESVSGDDGSLSLGAYAPGSTKTATVNIRAQSGIPSAFMTITSNGVTPTMTLTASGGTTIDSGGLNVGTATGAATGEVRASTALCGPSSVGAAAFAMDTTNIGTTISLANNATMQPTGANNFSGLMLITGTTVNGSTGLFLVGGGAIVLVSESSAGRYTTTAGTASRINVSIVSSVVTIENKSGSTATLRVTILRNRDQL